MMNRCVPSSGLCCGSLALLGRCRRRVLVFALGKAFIFEGSHSVMWSFSIWPIAMVVLTIVSIASWSTPMMAGVANAQFSTPSIMLVILGLSCKMKSLLSGWDLVTIER